MGASGAGKTTLLRLIAGLERPDSGSITIEGQDVTALPAQRRSVSLLLSQGALFPHLSAFENLAFSLHVNGERRSTLRSKVQTIAERLQVSSRLATSARLLSAGEQQRVALGRALLSAPKVLLLDEPVAHLDPPLRENVRKSIVEAGAERETAMVYVTHDHEDAFAVADRIAVLIDGRIAQMGTPEAIYDFPSSVQVARFVGPVPMNLFRGETDVLGVRAEHITLASDTNADLLGVVTGSSLVGASRLAHVHTEKGDARVVAVNGELPASGARVGLKFAPERVRHFDPVDGLAK